MASILYGSYTFTDIITTHPYSRDVVTASVVLGTCGGSGGRSTHAVQVVLTHKQTGELPEGGHVECLKHLALVGSSVPVECDADFPSLVVLVGEGYAGTQWDLFRQWAS